MNRIGCNNRIKLYTIHSALRTSLVVACRGSTNAYPVGRLHDTVGRELNRWLTLSASIKIARLREWNGNRGGRPWGRGASRQPPVGNTHPTAFHGASKNGCGEKRKSTDAIRDWRRRSNHCSRRVMGGEQRSSNQMTMEQRGTPADICIQIPRFPDPDSRAQHTEYRLPAGLVRNKHS